MMNDDPNYGTPYTETEAILAAGQGDWENLDKILAGMLPNEREALAEAARRLADSIAMYRRGAVPHDWDKHERPGGCACTCRWCNAH